jgi:peptidoglycan/xylan/chitin deacetylase (PgdA/CDA1 family)
MKDKMITGPSMHGEGNSRIIRVLLYHRIVDDTELSKKNWLCVDVRRFRQQLEMLDRWGFTPITFNDYSLFCRGELDLPAKPVIITFDDGYLDTYTNAFPVLQEFGMRAVVFVVGDHLVKTNYWDREKGLSESPLMESEQIIEMHEAGFEIGSHSMSHQRLTELSPENAWEEISRSRMVLEILLNDRIRSFSYPYGSLNGTTKRMVNSAGFEYGCGVSSGPAPFGEDLYEIRRTTIFNTTGTLRFALCMLTPYQYYSWFRWTIGQAISKVDRKQRKTTALLNEKKRRNQEIHFSSTKETGGREL